MRKIIFSILLNAALLLSMVSLLSASESKTVWNNAVLNGLTTKTGFNALLFDGASGSSQDDYVVTNNTDNQIYGSTAYSAEVWFYARSAGENNQGSIFNNVNVNPGFQMKMMSSSRSLGVIIYGDGSAKTTSASNYLFNWNEWNHAVFSWTSGSSPVIYINGSEASSYSSQTAVTTPNDDTGFTMFIGDRRQHDRTFDGYIRRVRMWRNKALTPSEVTTLYNGGVFVQNQTSSVSGVTAEFNFTDGSGTTLTDTSTNVNNGTLTNGPVWTNLSN